MSQIYTATATYHLSTERADCDYYVRGSYWTASARIAGRQVMAEGDYASDAIDAVARQFKVMGLLTDADHLEVYYANRPLDPGLNPHLMSVAYMRT